MSVRNVMDKLHNKHRLTHTGTAKQTNLTALAVWLEQVDYLDAGEQDFRRDSQIGKRRSRLVNCTTFFIGNRRQVVDWFTHYIEQTTLHLVACRHRNRLTHIHHLHTALQTVGTFHSHGAHGIFTNVLFNFKNQLRAIGLWHFQGGVDGWNLVAFAFKSHVDNRSDYLSDYSIFLVHNMCDISFF